MNKICKKCNIEKTLNEFSKNKDGFQLYCKICYSKISKERYSINKKVCNIKKIVIKPIKKIRHKVTSEEYALKISAKQKEKWADIKINDPELYRKKLDIVKQWTINNKYEYQFGKYRNRSKNKNQSFLLTLEEFKSLVDKHCHYCGKEKTDIKINGIDRKDNTKGYILDNCLTSCYECNMAKSNRSYEEYIKWILQSAKHLASIPTITPIVN